MPISDEPVQIGQAVPQTTPVHAPVDVLMQMEVPLSVSLGRIKMRMKELLSLTQGSVVELDQYVGDEVQILVNKCVLAHGEVVAIDGNYGVRITRLGGANPPFPAPENPAPVEEP